MTSEYDFLDEWLSEEKTKNNVSRLYINECSQSVDSFKETAIKYEQEEKLKKENLRLRSRVKWYCKALDEQRVRLTQLLTEKLAVREDQRKLVDFEKKLEEAKLYAQATEQLNKQLQELSKSHDKEKNEWKEKVTSLEEKIRELKKIVIEGKRKKEMEKKKRRKQLEILLELSEVLLKSGLFPKKYKRFHGLWKSELGNNEDGKDDKSFDFEENLGEESAEESTPNCEKKHEHMEMACSKENTSRESNSGALLALMSESESSEEETCVPESMNTVNMLSSLSESLNSGISIKCLSSDAKDGNSTIEDGQRTGFEREGGTSSTLHSLCNSADYPKGGDEIGGSSSRDLISDITLGSPYSLSGGCEEVKSKIERTFDSQLVGDDWGWTDDGCSRGSLTSDAPVVEEQRNAIKRKVKKRKEGSRCSHDSLDVTSILDEMRLVLPLLQPFDDVHSSVIESEKGDLTEKNTPVESIAQESGTVECDRDAQAVCADSFEICAPDNLEFMSQAVSKEGLGEKCLLQEVPSLALKDDVSNIFKPNKNSKFVDYEGFQEEDDEDGCIKNVNGNKFLGSSVEGSIACGGVNLETLLENGSHHLKENEQKSTKPTKLHSKSDANYVGADVSESGFMRVNSLLNNKSDIITHVNNNESFPDSGFNSPDSPIGDIEDHQAHIEKTPNYEADGIGITSDLDSLRDSGFLVKEQAIKPTKQSNSELTFGFKDLQNVQNTQEGIYTDKGEQEIHYIYENKSLDSQEGKTASEGVIALEKQCQDVSCSNKVTKKSIALKSKQRRRYPKASKRCSPEESFVNGMERRNVNVFQGEGKHLSPKIICSSESLEDTMCSNASVIQEKMVNYPKFQEAHDQKRETSDQNLKNSFENLLQLKKNGSTLMDSLDCEVDKSDEGGSCTLRERKTDILQEEDCVRNSQRMLKMRITSLYKEGLKNMPSESRKDGSVHESGKSSDNEQKKNSAECNILDHLSGEEFELLQTEDSHYISPVLEKSDICLSQGCGMVVLKNNLQFCTEECRVSVSESVKGIDIFSNPSSCENSFHDSEDSRSLHFNENTHLPISDRVHEVENSSSPCDLEIALEESSHFHSSKEYTADSVSVGLANESPMETKADKGNKVLFEELSSAKERSSVNDKIFGFISAPMPSFSELNNLNSTSVSQSKKPPREYFQSFASGWNSSKVYLETSEKTLVFPARRETSGNFISFGCVDQPPGESLCIFSSTKGGSIVSQKQKSVPGNSHANEEEVLENSSRLSGRCAEEVNTCTNWPLSEKHLSLLKVPVDSPLAHLIEKEEVKPKSTILVRCRYKSSSEGKCEAPVHDSNITDQIQSLLIGSLSLHDSAERNFSSSFIPNKKIGLGAEIYQPQCRVLPPSDSTQIMIGSPSETLNDESRCKSAGFPVSTAPQSKETNTAALIEKKKSSCTMKCKSNFTRSLVPFFFGHCNPNRFCRVKFRICGHFAPELFTDPYLAPNCSVVNFGQGDLKDLFNSTKTEHESSNIPPAKFLGVKFFKFGSFSLTTYTDRYLNPARPLINMLHKSSSPSSLTAGNVSLSPVFHEGENTGKYLASVSAAYDNFSTKTDDSLINSGALSESASVQNSLRCADKNSVTGVHHILSRVEALSFNNEKNGALSGEKLPSQSLHFPAEKDAIDSESVGSSFTPNSSSVTYICGINNRRIPQGLCPTFPSQTSESLVLVRRNDTNEIVSPATKGNPAVCKEFSEDEIVYKNKSSLCQAVIMEQSITRNTMNCGGMENNTMGPLELNINNIQQTDLITGISAKEEEKKLEPEVDQVHDIDTFAKNGECISRDSFGGIEGGLRSCQDNDITSIRENGKDNEESQSSNFNSFEGGNLNGEDDKKSIEGGYGMSLKTVDTLKNKSKEEAVGIDSKNQWKDSQEVGGNGLANRDVEVIDENLHFNEVNADVKDDTDDSKDMNEKNEEVPNESNQFDYDSSVDIPVRDCTANTILSSNISSKNNMNYKTTAEDLFGSDTSLDTNLFIDEKISRKKLKRKMVRRQRDTSDSEEEPLEKKRRLKREKGGQASYGSFKDDIESTDNNNMDVQASCSESNSSAKSTSGTSTSLVKKMECENLEEKHSEMVAYSTELQLRNGEEERDCDIRLNSTNVVNVVRFDVQQDNHIGFQDTALLGNESNSSCNTSLCSETQSLGRSSQTSSKKCTNEHQLPPNASKNERKLGRSRKQSLSQYRHEEDEVEFVVYDNFCDNTERVPFRKKVPKRVIQKERVTKEAETGETGDSDLMTENLAESLDDKYVIHSKKRRIAHTPKNVSAIGKINSDSVEENDSCPPVAPGISKPVSKKTSLACLSKSVNCQGLKTKCSKLEKLRNKLAKAKGIFSVSKSGDVCAMSVNKDVKVTELQLEKSASEEKLDFQKSSSLTIDISIADSKIKTHNENSSLQSGNKDETRKEEETGIQHGNSHSTSLSNDVFTSNDNQKCRKKGSPRKLLKSEGEVVTSSSSKSFERADEQNSSIELEAISSCESSRKEILHEKVLETSSKLPGKSSHDKLDASSLDLTLETVEKDLPHVSPAASAILSMPQKKEVEFEATDCGYDISVTHLELENMEVPPLSPLSADELVDSFILCTDVDNENWSPMVPAEKRKASVDLQEPESEKQDVGTISLANNVPDLLVNDDEKLKVLSIDEEKQSKDVSMESEGESIADQRESKKTMPEEEELKGFFHKLVIAHRGNQYRKSLNHEAVEKNRLLKKHLERLKHKYFKTQDLDLLVDALGDETKDFETKSIAKYLVRMLSKEDEDDVQHPYVDYAPRLSNVQIRILSLILALDRRCCHRFNDLINVILSGISYKLFRLGHAPQVEVIMPLARMYAVLCRIRRDIQLARTFCYDALFSLGTKAFSLIFVVLSVWPEVFIKQSKDRVPGYIEASILHAISHQRASKKCPEPKVIALKSLLRNVYKSDEHKFSPDDFLKTLISKLREGTALQDIEAAMVLLAKKQGWEWTHRNLLCGSLVSVMEDWKRGIPSMSSAILAIKLIGFTSRSCSTETSGPVKAIVEALHDALSLKNVYPMEIQEALVRSLICMSRHFHHRVSHALDLWVPTSKPSEELINILIGFIKRIPYDFWRKSFRALRQRKRMPKHINVQCRAGTYFTPADPEEFWGGKKSWSATGTVDTGGWKGKGKGPKKTRWIELHSKLDWIKEKEESWDSIAWVKPRCNMPQDQAGKKP